MSYNLDVISTMPEVVRWGDVLAEWRRILGAASTKLMGQSPKLMDAYTDEIINVSERLKPGNYYSFDLPVGFTTPLHVHAGVTRLYDKKPIDLEWATAYINAYVPRMALTEVQNLATRWVSSSGQYYTLETSMWRERHERAMFLALAAAVGIACQGYVVDVSGITDLPHLISSAHNFEKARWNIS